MQPLQRGSSGYRPPHARPPIVSPRSLTSASTTGTTPSDPLSRIPPLSNGRAPALSRGRLLLSVNRVQNSTPNGDALAVESRSSLPLVPKIETRVTPKHTSTTLRMESIFVEQRNERLAKGQAEKEKAAKKQRINKERKVQEAKRTAEEQAIGEKAEDKPKEETEQKSHKKRRAKEEAKLKLKQECEAKEAARQTNEVPSPEVEATCKPNDEEARKAQEQKDSRLAERRARRAAARKAKKAAERKAKEEAVGKEADGPRGTAGKVAQATPLELARAEPKPKAQTAVNCKKPALVLRLQGPSSSVPFSNLAVRKSGLPTKAQRDYPSHSVPLATAPDHLSSRERKAHVGRDGRFDFEEWTGRTRSKGMNKSMHKAKTWI
ncbi:hypothetical protein B0J17DRAFT_679896, partial [Rhizoctonia solani]